MCYIGVFFFFEGRGGLSVHICDQLTQHRDRGLSGEKLITVSFV